MLIFLFLVTSLSPGHGDLGLARASRELDDRGMAVLLRPDPAS